MTKEIVPHKLIITLNEDWTTQSGILSYRLREDGSMNSQKYYTMDVSKGINVTRLGEIVASARSHTEKGEKIDEKV